ncbi:N-alpha-acetyltransferase 25, NatB auxiliary subunit [Blomia tropicalis]|nr:N-alpha-acetyltransferase 25, NatB auxiliary subunit [Blomia tropicalis]
MSGQTDASYDRKLKPIYDYLDNGYYKKSLQEIDKLQKKNKDWLYLKVLKALTYIRMNRPKEGEEILEQVVQEFPYDDSTLQTITICYRDLHQNHLIPTLYENALKKDPINEKLFTNLFMAYVRVQDYKKQQLTALNLYKAHPKNPYYFWAVFSIYMQAITAKEGSIESKITFPLAEKMCEKFYNENRFEAEQEINLYLMILEKQNKFKEMLNLIDSDLGKQKLNDYLGFNLYRKIQLLSKNGLLQNAFEEMKELIKNNIDQYNYYMELFDLASNLDGQMVNSHKYIDQVLDLIDEMCDKTTNFKQRGPSMAKIVILGRIQQSIKKNKEKLDNVVNSENIFRKIEDDMLINLIFEYFENFNKKFACIKDIMFMLKNVNLTPSQMEKLLLNIKLSILNLNHETSTDEFSKSLCYYYLVHYSSDLSQYSQNKETELKLLYEFYQKNLIINWSHMNTKEFKENKPDENIITKPPFDPVVYLIANKSVADIDIYDYDITSNSTYFDLLTLLEHSLKTNTDDYYCKLLLVRLYNVIGACASSHALYENLDIKLIQCDTMGHFFLVPFLSSGHYSYARQFLAASWKFYSFNFKDTSDFLINSYKNGTFKKIEEIMSFNTKLRTSIQYHITRVEQFFLNLIIECKNNLTFKTFAIDYVTQMVKGNLNFDFENVCDNRDNLLNCNHHQLDLRVETLRKKTFNDECLWLHYRITLLEVMIISYNLSENLLADSDRNLVVNGGTVSTSIEHEKLTFGFFNNLINQMEELIIVSKKYISENSSVKYCLEGPTPSKLNSYFSTQQSSCVMNLLHTLRSIFNYCAKSEVDIDIDSLIENFKVSIFLMKYILFLQMSPKKNNHYKQCVNY